MKATKNTKNTKTSKINVDNYPFIKAWGIIHGQREILIEYYAHRAERDGYGSDAVYSNGDGTWTVIGDFDTNSSVYTDIVSHLDKFAIVNQIDPLTGDSSVIGLFHTMEIAIDFAENRISILDEMRSTTLPDGSIVVTGPVIAYYIRQNKKNEVIVFNSIHY